MQGLTGHEPSLIGGQKHGCSRDFLGVGHASERYRPRRFGEFQKKLGLAKNILSTRLRVLVDRAILATAPASDGSAYQEYVLTPKGRGLFPILVALRQWSEEFDDKPQEIATLLVDRQKGKPVRTLALYSQDGRLLKVDDTMLKPKLPTSRSRRVPA